MRIPVPVLAILFVACSSPAPAPADDPAPPDSAATARPDPGADAGVAPATGAPLVFTAQPGWLEEPPASAMRVAQYRIPGADGAGDASLVVYHFAGPGGSLDANLRRWALQFEQPDGGDSMERMEHSERTVAGMRVHEAYLSGTYVAETSPGSGERVNHPGWRLMAAIVESDHGPYYVKLVGPEATARANDRAFRGFLGALRTEP